MSNTPKEQTAEDLLQLSYNLRQTLFVRPFDICRIESAAVSLCDAVISSDEQMAFKQPPTEDKQPGETVSLEAVIELINEYPFFFKNDACRLTLTTQIRNLTGRE